MGSGSTDRAIVTERAFPYESRETALIDAVSAPPANEAGLLVESRCSLVWPGMKLEVDDDIGEPVGRCHAGTVERVHSCLRSWTPGERVSGIGRGSEPSSNTIFIPIDLAAKVPMNVSFEEATFAAPGYLAVRAVRLAGIKKGATVAVAGLGLPGRLACKLLTMLGCRVLGLDNLQDSREADRIPEIYSAFPIKPDSASRILDVTSGKGVDAVIVSAVPEFQGLVEMAGSICGKNAKVVVLGIYNGVPPGGVYQERNLTLISTGPYISGLEQLDRETSPESRDRALSRTATKRDMQVFLDLISTGRIEVRSLFTHRFHVDMAYKAHEMISDHNRHDCLAVLINSDRSHKEPKPKLTLPQWGWLKPVKNRDTTIGIIGADQVDIAMQPGFEMVHLQPEELITDPEVDSVYISNIHNRHFDWIVKSLLSGKATFVDGCLCLNEDELEQIEAAYRATGAPLMIGYSRRFAPLTAKIREILRGRRYPVSVHYRINSGSSVPVGRVCDPHDDRHPVFEKSCEYLDLVSYLVGGRPVRIFAEALSMPDHKYRCDDNLQVMIRYSDGSVGTINYAASGDSQMNSEYLEILGDGMAIRMNDFRSLVVASNDKLDTNENEIQDTGRMRMIQLWRYYLTTGLGSPIAFEELKYDSLAVFRIIESLEDGSPARIVD